MIRRTACLIARELDLYRSQAIQRHLMDTLPEETAILYLWQADRAVVLGRSQDAHSECAAEGLKHCQLGRRLSGGESMYQDLGTLGYAIILPKLQFDIPRQLSLIGMASGAFGLQPRVGRRSSLTIDGRTFAQTAFFKSGSVAEQHGVIHVRTHLEALTRALGQNHITNLAAYQPNLSISAVQEALYWAFSRVYGAQPVMLDERMLNQSALRRMTMQFDDAEWIDPAPVVPTLSLSEQFPWGKVTVALRTEGGVIRQARLYTDAMEAGLFPLMEKALTGTPFLVSAIAARIRQQLSMLRDPALLQIVADVENLIRRNIRGR